MSKINFAVLAFNDSIYYLGLAAEVLYEFIL